MTHNPRRKNRRSKAVCNIISRFNMCANTQGGVHVGLDIDNAQADQKKVPARGLFVDIDPSSQLLNSLMNFTIS